MRIADIKPGQQVRTQLLVSRAETRVSRTGGKYLWSLLKDREGASMVALMFDAPASALDSVVPGVTVDVVAEADEYQGNVNLKLTSIDPAAEQWDLSELLPKSEKDPDEMLRNLREYAAGIEDTEVSAVVESVLRLPQVADRLAKWPAAKMRHHAVVGGLIEHVLEVLSLADATCRIFPALDKSLLFAGCILHDIGKVVELSLGAEIDYAPEGVMVGHVVIGDELVNTACVETKCPPDKAMVLRNLVLSHHGSFEFGSPVLPKTPEAVALHLIDMLSSQTRNALESVAHASHRSPGDPISQWDRSAARSWFIGASGPQQEDEAQ